MLHRPVWYCLCLPWEAAERETDGQTSLSLNSSRLGAWTASKPAVQPLQIQRVEVRRARQPVPAGYLLQLPSALWHHSLHPALNSRGEVKVTSSPTSSSLDCLPSWQITSLSHPRPISPSSLLFHLVSSPSSFPLVGICSACFFFLLPPGWMCPSAKGSRSRPEIAICTDIDALG